MDQVARDWYELRLQVEFLKRRGAAFQDFFADVMSLGHPRDFVRVRAAGPTGDLKNDGYLASSGTVFQCYGPDEMDARGVAKMKADFAGAKTHWPTMKQWVYVHNHPLGVACNVLAEAKTPEANDPEGLTVATWSLEAIRDEVFRLSDEDIRALLGPAPERRDVIGLRFDAIEPLVQALALGPVPIAPSVTAPSPEKLEYNRLSDFVRRLLVVGMERTPQVREFFGRSPNPALADRVAAAFRARYEELKGHGLGPDRIFAELQAFVSGDRVVVPAEQAAALALLAYLFERCDIFDDVPTGVP